MRRKKLCAHNRPSAAVNADIKQRHLASGPRTNETPLRHNLALVTNDFYGTFMTLTCLFIYCFVIECQ